MSSAVAETSECILLNWKVSILKMVMLSKDGRQYILCIMKNKHWSGCFQSWN